MGVNIEDYINPCLELLSSEIFIFKGDIIMIESLSSGLVFLNMFSSLLCLF